MWNKPTEAELLQLPKLYATENVPPKEKMIHLHFFIGGSDWYAAEYGGGDDKLFFGFAILNEDYEMAEWGYFSLQELSELKVSFLEVDRDLHWTPTQAQNIPAICKAEGWNKEVVNQVK